MPADLHSCRLFNAEQGMFGTAPSPLCRPPMPQFVSVPTAASPGEGGLAPPGSALRPPPLRPLGQPGDNGLAPPMGALPTLARPLAQPLSQPGMRVEVPLARPMQPQPGQQLVRCLLCSERGLSPLHVPAGQCLPGQWRRAVPAGHWRCCPHARFSCHWGSRGCAICPALMILRCM